MIALWWKNRTHREKWAVATALGALAMAATTQMLVLPMMAYRSKEAMRYAAELALGAELNALGSRWSTPESPDTPIQTAVAEAANRFGLSLERFLPADNGNLTVWLHAADPIALYGWLMYLDNTHSISVTRITLDLNQDQLSLGASVSFTARFS